MPGLNPSLTQRRKFAGSCSSLLGEQPALVLIEMLGHHLAVADPHEQIGQGKLGAGVGQRAAGAKQLGESRDEAGSFRSPCAVNQQWGIRRCQAIRSVHATARATSRRKTTWRCRSGLRLAWFVAATSSRYQASTRFDPRRFKHRLDLMSGNGRARAPRRHLARPIDAVRAEPSPKL